MAIEKRPSIVGSIGRYAISDNIKIVPGWKCRIVANGEFQRLDATLHRKDDLWQFVRQIDHATDTAWEDSLESSGGVLCRDEDMRSDLGEIVVDESRREMNVRRGGNHWSLRVHRHENFE